MSLRNDIKIIKIIWFHFSDVFLYSVVAARLAPQPRAGVVFQAFWFALLGT